MTRQHLRALFRDSSSCGGSEHRCLEEDRPSKLGRGCSRSIISLRRKPSRNIGPAQENPFGRVQSHQSGVALSEPSRSQASSAATPRQTLASTSRLDPEAFSLKNLRARSKTKARSKAPWTFRDPPKSLIPRTKVPATQPNTPKTRGVVFQARGVARNTAGNGAG